VSTLRGRMGSLPWGRAKIVAGVAAVAALVVAGGSAGAGPAPRVPKAVSTEAASTEAASTKAVSTTAITTKAAVTTATGQGPRTASATASDWVTYDWSPARAGVAASTPAVTTASAVKRGWTAKVDGSIYGQPLLVGKEVIVATENDSVYAFDRYSGRRLWRLHVGTPVTSTDLPCGDIGPTSGITGTPVADVATDRLYVVSFSPFVHTLWTLDLTTGRVIASRVIDGPGDDPKAEQQRGALLIDGSYVFVPYGGLAGDCSDYHGWVVGAPLSGRGKLIHYVTPTQREAGIWSPPGPSAGPSGLYVATGNGTPVNAVDNSDSVIRLSPKTLKVESIFTPSDYVKLSTDDLDLGTTSPVLLPHNQLFMIGKEGIGYVLGATHLGGLGHPLAQAPVCARAIGGDAVVGDTVIISCSDGLYAVRVTPGSTTVKPTLRVIWSVPDIQGGPPIVAGGIVWDVPKAATQLLGFQLSNGHQWFAAKVAPPITSFPGLSASKERLFVPEGSEVVCYRGL
jgi:outer membrane protein assembly factor BamB